MKNAVFCAIQPVLGQMCTCVMIMCIRQLVRYKCLSNCCENTTYSNVKFKSSKRRIRPKIVNTAAAVARSLAMYHDLLTGPIVCVMAFLFELSDLILS